MGKHSFPTFDHFILKRTSLFCCSNDLLFTILAPKRENYRYKEITQKQEIESVMIVVEEKYLTGSNFL